jgi:carbon-monoxide dehydrogenase small subunit
MSDSLKIGLSVNGSSHVVNVTPRRLLSDVLREDLGLTGTHVGCEHGVCGACTILIDDRPARACITFAIQMERHEVTTIEAVARNDIYSPLQQAMHEEHGLQCGFCTPGIIMTFEAYLRDNPDPSETEIRDVLSGNICRCTGYQGIVAAVMKAAADIRKRQP